LDRVKYLIFKIFNVFLHTSDLVQRRIVFKVLGKKPTRRKVTGRFFCALQGPVLRDVHIYIYIWVFIYTNLKFFDACRIGIWLCWWTWQVAL
jgi:hypothetical protein